MARLLTNHRDAIVVSSDIADYIVGKGTRSDVRSLYDIACVQPERDESYADIFARLMRVEESGRIRHYRICLNDDEITDFLSCHPDIDLLTFLVFVMTHELLHIQRFSCGQADFSRASHDEEILVDNLTRLLMAKHPVTGRGKVFKLLDKLAAPPLYNQSAISDGGIINAYL
jgi:hypothetical protein